MAPHDYDDYDYVDEEPRRHKSHSHHSHRSRDDRDFRYDDREPRYVETEETYIRAPAKSPVALAADPPTYARETIRQTDLIRRPAQGDNDSIEEVRRDFPPPGGAVYGVQRSRSMVRDDRYGSRDRSPDRAYGAYLGDPRRSANDLPERGGQRSRTVKEEVIERPRRSLSRNQKIIAAVGGAALALGGKELFDRRQAEGRPVSRNALTSAAVGAAGAFAAYEGAEFYNKRQHKEEKVKTYVAHEGRNGDVAEYYSTEEEESPKEKKKSRRKSISEGALGLLGLGAAGAAAHKGGDRHGDEKRSRSRRGSGASTKSTKDGNKYTHEGAAKFQQAAKAALLAGAAEAFRVRKEPGGWAGEKGKRILTAAIGAGGIDAVADKDPEKKSKRHILEAVVAGLAGNRLINGSRKEVEEDPVTGRSRSRSRARSASRGSGGGGLGAGTGLAALATAGLGALAGKKLLDRSRSRSRDDRGRGRRGSGDSYDSRSPSPDGKKKRSRSKSVVSAARKGLAALGIGEAAKEEDDRDHRPKSRQSRNKRYDNDDYYSEDEEDYRDARRSPRDRGDKYGNPHRSAMKKDGQRNAAVAKGKGDGYTSESSLGSSSGDEKRIKKMKGKQLLTAGLATIATIHAAHNVYQSMEKRDARHKAVQEGEMTPEVARKLRTKATLQDVASIGIAALGIKGAISEIKEANEIRREYREFSTKKEERHKKRIERLKKSSSSGGGSSNGSANESGRQRSDYDTNYDQGPVYRDGNPYSSLPAPPVGYDDRR